MTRESKLAEALRHCVKIFKSMADRGAYPQELLPCDSEGRESPVFTGKQGFQFALDALAAHDAREGDPAKSPFYYSIHPGTSEYHTVMCPPPSGDAQAREGERAEPSDDELKRFAVEEEFLLFCSEDEFLDIAKSVLRRFGASKPRPEQGAQGQPSVCDLCGHRNVTDAERMADAAAPQPAKGE
jgi:hypothetical protein